MAKSSLGKRIFKSQAFMSFAFWFITVYLRVIERSVRWRREYDPEAQSLIEGEKAFIACFWHGRMVMMSSAWTAPPERMHLLISTHRDGQLISQPIRKLGYKQIEGSSGHGGVHAFREMARVLRQDHVVAITPDGPRGPRMRVKPGVLKIAQLTGKPIVPLSGAVKSCWMLKSWDRFLIPKPFTKGLLSAGKPITIAKDLNEAELEAIRLQLEEELQGLAAAADRAMGREAVPPGPVEQ